MTRQDRLAILSLVGGFVRIGHSPKHGPVFKLVSVDHSRDVFHTVNIANGIKSTISVGELHSAIHEGIAHTRKVGEHVSRY